MRLPPSHKYILDSSSQTATPPYATLEIFLHVVFENISLETMKKTVVTLEYHSFTFGLWRGFSLNRRHCAVTSQCMSICVYVWDV